MKNQQYILLFIISLFISQNIFSQENFEKTKLVTTVFKALKKQNEKKILRSLPTKEDIKYLIPLVKTANPKENIPEVDSIILEFKTGAIESFRKAIKKGIAFGIEWDNIVLQKVKYEANPEPKLQIERGKITLVCSSNEKKFLIILKKSSKIRGTWRLMNPIKFTLI